ncbi:hypothetical protein B0T11DRAFT_326405 [Plectosphaerella cucumerina]|uniref:Uncharacterized protein n=1 Tax=Plectosphaerella cucumerina TaxID=40658 RepID=A0A8K0X6D7_9PEZI|nr:hypothetical protein B0T11DRAFT_326405 [Plectosphaerella cucumerina]
MAAANVISVIGTGITLLSFILGNLPETPDKAKVSYIIANDGANGDLSSAGGDLPDIRHWDETAEFLGASYDPGHCGEGVTTCTTDVNTQEAVTYTLFSGNNDAICIAWTGLSWAGGQKKYGFHPGNWAHACDQTPHNNGYWYYAGQQVPGINYADDVFCAWVDRDGDIPTTGFQVHWPEFDGDNSPVRDLNYYCGQNPPVYYHTETDPSTVHYWVQRRNLFSQDASTAVSSPADAPEKKRRAATETQGAHLVKRFEKDIRIIKSRFGKHTATQLCDPNAHSAGPSFVSYVEEKFCHMPTKTVYDFCGAVEDGACWDDDDNKVVVKGDGLRVGDDVPNLDHITKIVVWE